jgi:hypothetical protein
MDHLNTGTWRKAGHSTSNGGACVEVASAPGAVAVRDSKDPQGPVLVVPLAHFRHLTDTLKGD